MSCQIQTQEQPQGQADMARKEAVVSGDGVAPVEPSKGVKKAARQAQRVVKKAAKRVQRVVKKAARQVQRVAKKAAKAGLKAAKNCVMLMFPVAGPVCGIALNHNGAWLSDGFQRPRPCQYGCLRPCAQRTGYCSLPAPTTRLQT